MVLVPAKSQGQAVISFHRHCSATLSRCVFTACKSEKITRSTKDWRDLIGMNQKHQVNMSLTSKEVHEVRGDIAIGCKDSADARGTRRAWGTCGSLCSVRHQVLENTLF